MTALTPRLRRLLSSPYMISICLALSMYWGLGSVPLFDLDEGAFTEATREMIASGNYAATYLDGEPRYDKPIFFYWLQAASIHSFGFNEWAFRLPSAVMATLWAFALFSFCREFIGRQRAVIATLFMVNSLWIALIARSAIADATLNLFLSLTMFDIWRYLHGARQRSLPILLRVYLWMALGTLTKGPVAVVVPLVTSLLYLLSSRAPARQYWVYISPLGWLVYLAVVTPWLIAVYLDQGDGFFHGFIVEHNLKRFSATRESHGGSLFYYFFALPLILLPVSGLLPGVFAKLKRHWHTPLHRFLLLWFALIFTIFSFSKTQLPHYILNSCVPLIILIAKRGELFNKRRWTTLAPLAMMALFALLPALVSLAAAQTGGYNGAVIARYSEAFTPGYLFAASLALGLMTLAILARGLLTWHRLVLCGLVLNVFTYTTLVKAVSELQQAPIHHAIAFLQQRGGSETVVAYKMQMPSFSVYRQQATPLRKPEVGEIALMRVDRVHRLHNELQQAHYRELFRSGGLVLVKVFPGAPRDE